MKFFLSVILFIACIFSFSFASLTFTQYQEYYTQVDEYRESWELEKAGDLLEELIVNDIEIINTAWLKTNYKRIIRLREEQEMYWAAVWYVDQLISLAYYQYELDEYNLWKADLLYKKNIWDVLVQLNNNKDYFGIIEFYNLNKDFLNEWSTILTFVYGAYLETTDLVNAYNIAKMALANAKSNAKKEMREENVSLSKSALEAMKTVQDTVDEDYYLPLSFNDTHIWQQFYIKSFNIDKAWKLIPTYPKQVIIAVIDDWINPNHPDLTKNIWTNTKEIKDNWIDDDKNWYVDDYIWFNSILKNWYVIPYWEHWTMVAWIIWAEINNNEGIAWITKKVKIMPVVACYSNEFAQSLWYDAGGCDFEAIIRGIRYAIKNWANIINLSLWWEWFNYTNAYDAVIQEAYNNWVIVVVAAWNWDWMQIWERGVNTDLVSVSPVCNDSFNKKAIFGVSALQENWTLTKRSNYWKCADFSAYWEEIISTSVPVYNSQYWINYNKLDWTSFSAPMIAWIIWLWFNKYGSIRPDIVYNALKNSMSGNIIDAEKFINNLSANNNTELVDAISWMYNNWLTMYNTIEKFLPNNYLTREEASKFFVMYSKAILNKAINSDKYISFYDLKSADPTLQSYIKESYQLWLFQGYKWKFMPFNKLTQAQAIAVIMRSINGFQTENNGKWYDSYYSLINHGWILDWLRFDYNSLDSVNITRWEVALLLYRLTK